MANRKNPIRSQAGKIGGHVLHARNDSQEIASRARGGFRSKFEREVDPEGLLPEAERLRCAQHALKAHMAHLAIKSAKARSMRHGTHE